MATVSITTHAIWPQLVPFIDIEPYARDTGPRGARVRIEVKRPFDGALARTFQQVTMPCVACGRQIHPIRPRVQGRHLGKTYYKCSCDQELTRSCSRGAAARAEYWRVRRAVERWRRDTQQLNQPKLWE